jgi:hypothetical protein
MDNGEVLQGIEEDWNFMGANVMEWSVGFVAFLLISLFARSPARAMPFMLAGGVLTTTTLAALRRTYPDAQRGLTNASLTACGFPPPGIPAPAVLQPVWSGAPLKMIREDSKFSKIGLNKILPSFERDATDATLDEQKTMRV